MWRSCGLLIVLFVLSSSSVTQARALPSVNFTRVVASALPGQNLTLPSSQFSGYVIVNSTCSAGLYFWLVKAQNNNANAPVVLFLNGGPGSSSFLGWLFENIGPYNMNDDGSNASINPYTWSQKMDVLIFDQPAGVGYSFVQNASCYPTNLQQSTAHLASAIEAIYAQPAFSLQGKALTVVAESYGGTYAPLVAQALLRSPYVKLNGIALGDGWVNPLLQQSTYALYAYEHGLLSESQRQHAESLFSDCATAILSSQKPAPSSVNDICNLVEAYIVNVSNCNVYDVRETGDYDMTALTNFLNRPDVIRTLGVDKRALPWAAGSDAIGTLFAIGEQDSYSHVVSYLLQNNLPVLAYNGIYDMDCGFTGTDLWLQDIAFQNFSSIDRQLWTVAGQTAGTYRTLGPLSQVLIYGSGHLVPYNVPAVAKELIERFAFTKGVV